MKLETMFGEAQKLEPIPEVPGQCIAETEQSVTETTPSGLEIKFFWEPHIYHLNGVVVPSVTQVLKVLYKGGLDWHGMRVGIAGVLKLYEDGLLPAKTDAEEIEELLKAHKLTVNDRLDKDSTRGSGVHKSLEEWCADRVLPVAENWPEEQQGFVAQLARFLEVVGPHVDDVESELMLGSLTHSYAGKCDLAFTLLEPLEVVTRAFPKRNDRVEEIPAGRYRVDMKTRKSGKHPYNTDFLQAEAYEGAAVECGYQSTDYRAVLIVTPTGYEFVVNDEWTFPDFTKVRELYTVMNEREILRELREELGAKEAA